MLPSIKMHAMKKYVNLVKLTSILYLNYPFPPKIMGSKSLVIEQTLGPLGNPISPQETSFMLYPQCDAIWSVLKHDSSQAVACVNSTVGYLDPLPLFPLGILTVAV